MTHGFVRSIAVRGVLCAWAWIAGCAGPTPPPANMRPEAGPVVGVPRLASMGRTDAVAGSPLVLPLSSPVDPGLAVTLDDGRALGAVLAGVAVTFSPEELYEPWSGPAGVWAARRVGEAGQAVVVIETPIDAAGHALLVGGLRVDVNWLPPTGALPRAEPGSPVDLWRPGRPAPMPPGVEDSPRFAGEAKSPLTRWRWRLMRDGLNPDAPESGAFDDPTIELIARQAENRWRVALARLWGTNADLAARLKAKLCACVDFGNGEWAPAWATDTTSLDALLSAMLDPGLTPAARSAYVERWLAEQPGAVAWVIDDGGTLDAARAKVLTTVAVASLLDRATLSWATPRGAEGSPELVPLNPGQVRVFVTPPFGAGPNEIRVNAGEWAKDLLAASEPAPLLPPGLTMSPFGADLSMHEWLAGTASSATAATAARIHKPATEPGAIPEGIRSRRWELYVECAVPERGDPAKEEVLLYVGPLGRPYAAIRVRMSGEVEALPAPGELAGLESAPSATVIRSPGRWSCRMALPAGSVERDGLLRVAMVRIDALGRRSAWPRAMLPWQAEPARYPLDTKAWADLGAEPGQLTDR